MMGCSTLQIPQGGKAYGHTEKETTFEKNQERKGAGGIIRQMRE